MQVMQAECIATPGAPVSRAWSQSGPLRHGLDSANVWRVNRLTAKCITATKTPCNGAFRMRVHV
jgi:hypothetical protein